MKICKAMIFVCAASYLIGCGSESHYRNNSKSYDIAYLWSLARYGSVDIKEDITFCGTVVINDKLDEVTNRIVVADKSGGIEIAIDSENINRIIPLFSNVRVSAMGLSIGRQGRKCVLGKHPTGEYVVDRLTEKELPYYISEAHDIKTLDAQVIKIADINTEHLLHYVCVENVRFVDEEVGLTWCDCDEFGECINTIRHLTDGTDTLRVACSKECIYANEPLPADNLRCFGIIDYVESDIALRICNNYITTLSST